jgi:hypothetical protein
MVRRLALGGAAALLALVASSASAAAIFEDVFVKVQADAVPDMYSPTFAVAKAGFYVVWIQNGDDGGGKITNATVTLTPTTGTAVEVAPPALFAGPKELITKIVFLSAQTWTVNATLTDPGPGAFFGLAIAPAADALDLSVGRLLLPYADSTTSIVLRNGAPFHKRHYVIHNFNSAGALVAWSGVQTLDPSASYSGLVSSAVALGTGAGGAFANGSITVLWIGQGPARMFGTAATSDPTTPTQTGLVEMEHAGYRNRDRFKLLNQ